MSKKRKSQDIFHKIQCVLSIVISCIALLQTAQMINISRSMETLAKKQNQDVYITDELPRLHGKTATSKQFLSNSGMIQCILSSISYSVYFCSCSNVISFLAH